MSIAEESQPVTGRGVGYKLFSLRLIASMSTNDMQTVYRLLKEAREEGTIPWDWIVDEIREYEQVATWDNPAAYLRAVRRSYRRDHWQHGSRRAAARARPVRRQILARAWRTHAGRFPALGHPPLLYRR